jgi:hypothetical protein
MEDAADAGDVTLPDVLAAAVLAVAVAPGSSWEDRPGGVNPAGSTDDARDRGDRPPVEEGGGVRYPARLLLLLLASPLILRWECDALEGCGCDPPAVTAAPDAACCCGWWSLVRRNRVEIFPVRPLRARGEETGDTPDDEGWSSMSSSSVAPPLAAAYPLAKPESIDSGTYGSGSVSDERTKTGGAPVDG